MPATRTDWDALPETVRDFLAAVAGGTVIERGGTPVGRWVPISTPTPDDGEWTDAKNHRRCELIDRIIEGTITAEERDELDLLKRQLRSHVRAVAPLPLDEARELHQGLLDLATKRRGETQP